MKTVLSVIFVVLFTSYGFSAIFFNLGFDEANTNNLTGAFSSPDGNPPYSSGFASVADLLPGWTLERDDRRELALYVDALLPNNGFVSLYSPAINAKGQPFPVAERFSLAFWPSPLPTGGPILQYSLSQTGDIPADAQSIRFTGYGSQLELKINDTPVPLVYIYEPFQPSSFLRADVMANIAPFAGQTVELKFSTIAPTIAGDFGIDSIIFSPEIVPEPSTALLLSLSAAVLAAVRLGVQKTQVRSQVLKNQ